MKRFIYLLISFLVFLLVTYNLSAQKTEFWDKSPVGYWMGAGDDDIICELKFSKDGVYMGYCRDFSNQIYKRYNGRWRLITQSTMEIRVQEIVTEWENGKKANKKVSYKKPEKITYAFTNIRKLSINRMPWIEFNREYTKVND